MTEFGYLIPTREAVMSGQPQTQRLLRLGEQAMASGFSGLWVGDSLLARPRHDPLTLLAALAVRCEGLLGTAVLLPAYRNPVVLAQQAATLDQLCEGRLVLGVGIAADNPSVRAEFKAAGVEFERRVGRMQEGLRLCRALWTGEPVDWNGRWELEQAQLGPQPCRPGGPLIWGAGSHPGALRRAGATMDGWLPITPGDGAEWTAQWNTVMNHAQAAGRQQPKGAHYLTICIDDDAARADRRIDDYLHNYYHVPGALMRKVQACKGGPADEVAAYLQDFVQAGVDHIVLRMVGEHDEQIARFATICETQHWA